MKPAFNKLVTVYLTTDEGQARGIGHGIQPRSLFVEAGLLLDAHARLKVTFAGEDGTEMTALCEVRYRVELTLKTPKSGLPVRRQGLGLRILGWEAWGDDKRRLPH